MWKYLKIGQKLVIILLFISLLPLAAISYYSFSFAKAELTKKTTDALQAVTDSRASHISHSIRLRQEQAKEFAGAYLLRQLSETGVNDPQIIEGIQNDIDSTFLDLNLTPTSQYQNIDRITDVEIIGVWDVHGTIIANTDRKLLGMRMPPVYMQKVYEQGTYFRGFEKDPLTKKNFLIHLEEIRNWKSNRIVGALSLKVRARILDEITTSREGLGVSGETYVVDKNYAMITQSRFIEHSILKVRVDTAGTRACFSGRKAPMIYKNYRGVEVLGVQKYLPDEQWCLLSEIDAQEALAPMRELRSKTTTIGWVLIAVILLLSYLVARAFTKPIRDLSDAAQEVAQGHYDTTVEVKTKDEVGGLAEAFNNMVLSLAKAAEQLEEKSKTLFKHLALSTRQSKELKEVNQELDSFVYTASHDLRAPLRGIASFASFLEEDYKDKLDERGREYIDEIKKGAGKMNDFIEDLLQLSRISRIKNPYEQVKIAEMINGILERLKFDIENNAVEMVLQKDMPTVTCDRIKMGEVFYNLINNAIKFSSKNNTEHPKVVVGCVEEGPDYKFFVKDNGIGIDPKYHEQIFGIFKRLHTDKEYEGTGAGLSIIKRVIDDHQGKIWIDSTPGQGAAFYFTIPKDLKNQDESGEQPGEAEEQ